MIILCDNSLLRFYDRIVTKSSFFTNKFNELNWGKRAGEPRFFLWIISFFSKLSTYFAEIHGISLIPGPFSVDNSVDNVENFDFLEFV